MLHFFRCCNSSLPISFLLNSKNQLYAARFFTSSSSSSINSATNLSNLLQGHTPIALLLQIHALVYLLGAHQDNLIATRLIGRYPSHLALPVFHHLSSPNLFPFNAVFRVLAEQGLCSLAFSIFRSMKLRSLLPNDFTFSFLLKACLGADDPSYVKQIHTHVVKSGFGRNSFVCNALLVVYGKRFRDLSSAHKIFDEMSDKGLPCSWTSLISGFAQSGLNEVALRLFLSMLKENVRPQNDTMVSVLSACSNLETAQIERWARILSESVHNFEPIHSGHDTVNVVLVYLFGKWGKIDLSRQIFDKITETGKRSVLPWNAMIGSYVQNGCAMEALCIFRLMMENQCCSPNHVTMVSVLSACAAIGDIDLGIWVHEYMKSNGRRGILASNTNLATALIDLYAKCGSSERAREVFDQMISKDVVSFNAMIMGLAMNGEGEEALRLFSNMQEFSLHPNAGTFLGVLCACSHSGFLQKGRQIFADMSQCYSVSPNLEHYACYIDLLARVGCIEEAFQVVNTMPIEPNSFVWGALLGGCLLHNRTQLAQDITKILVKMDPENSASYVMLSNACAVGSRWDDVSGLRQFMRNKGVRKQPGHTWISIHGIVHDFLAGCLSHPHNEGIYDMLNSLSKEMKLVTY